MKFNELPLHQSVLDGIEYASFVECMDVQENVLPVSLTGKDVMVQSKTGSGKTAVFLLTILQNIAQQKAEGKTPEGFALIIAPTRELAVQIEEDAYKLSHGMKDTRIGCFYGGVGYQKQDKALASGIDLVIGTPGRILDYQKMGKIDFRKVNSFVIDEADRLFDMGFYPDIQRMFSLMSPKEKRQTMLFSATLSNRVRNLAWKYMNEPEEFEVQMEEVTVTKITQELYHVSSDEKFSVLLRLLEREKPESCLIFTNTKAKAVEVTKRLELNSYKTQYLMGDLAQHKRLQVINRMKSGELRFLVATDVAARGLQIDDLQLVVNYDIPEDFENYVHRIGRTARAGKSGKSITLACEEFVYSLESIEQYIQMKIPVIWIDEESLPLVKDASEGMRFRDLVSRNEFAGGGSDRGRKDSSRRRTGGRSPQPSRSHDSQHRPPKGPKTHSKKDHQQKPHVKKEFHQKPYDGERSGKSYQDIQKMSLEQRMAYYKNQYLPEDGDRQSKPQGKTKAQSQGKAQRPSAEKGTSQGNAKNQRPKQDTTPRNRRPAQDAPQQRKGEGNKGSSKPKPAGERTPKRPAPPVQQEIRREETPQKPKKRGLIARLLGRKNG